MKIELDRDGFSAGESIVTDKTLQKIAFTLENRTQDAHSAGLWLSFPIGAQYDVIQDGKKVALSKTANWDYPWRAELQMGGGPSKVEIVRTDR